MSELLQFILSSSEQFRSARLPSLYSDFRLQRSSNPDGFAANVSAWEQALRRAAQAGLIPGSRDTLSLRTSEELLQALATKQWGRPLALGTAVDEAVAKRHLIPVQEFLDMPTGIYGRSSWAVRPWWLVEWGLRQLGVFEKQAALGKLPTKRYVVVANVEEAAGKVLARLGSRTNLVDRIYSRDMFSEEATKAMELRSGLSESDLQVLLRHLARDKGAIIYDDQTVKLRNPDEPQTLVSPEDKTIASLRSLIADLNVQITALDVRIASLNEKAQASVQAKNRVAALAALKSKKAAETTLAQRYDTLAQLEGVYGKIEQASDQVALVRVMKGSTGVLRNLHSQVGGVEKVEDVVEGLREEMSKVDEIGQVMEEAGRGEAVVDEDEIDEELAALERRDQLEKEEKEAEQTRQRLAEIDAAGSSATAAEDHAKVAKQSEDQKVTEDIEALGRLSLDEDQSSRQQADQRPQENSNVQSTALES